MKRAGRKAGPLSCPDPRSALASAGTSLSRNGPAPLAPVPSRYTAVSTLVRDAPADSQQLVAPAAARCAAASCRVAALSAPAACEG